jgi:hypothetical protein
MAELSNDIADARRAVRLAYEPALKRQEKAREEFEHVQRRAIVLGDGRRVYFTEDGKRLYGEDRFEITDAALLEEARRKATRNNPIFETYLEKIENLDSANAQVEKLNDILHRLDELDERVKSGKVTPEQFAELRRETDRIIETLPPDAREEFERLRKSREGDMPVDYREADPTLTSTLDLGAQFAKAHASTLPETPQEKIEAAKDAGRDPAYKSVPEF